MAKEPVTITVTVESDDPLKVSHLFNVIASAAEMVSVGRFSYETSPEFRVMIELAQQWDADRCKAASDFVHRDRSKDLLAE